jgi:hypothetical protein
MPEPGKAMTPAGRVSSIWSLRLNGAALRWRIQSGLKAICATLRSVGPAGGDALGPARRAAMQEHQVGVLGAEDSIAELCRREGIVQNLYYRWSKEFLEAGKKRLAGE